MLPRLGRDDLARLRDLAKAGLTVLVLEQDVYDPSRPPIVIDWVDGAPLRIMREDDHVDDFVYLPVGVEHGIANESQEPLRLLVMGFAIPEGTKVPPTPERMMASADDVRLQVLASHGPTTQFKLLLGTTQSTRDKLAAAQRINSLFLMDFAPGGTNIPHRHNREEEIYYVLRGQGDMVAGSDAAKKEMRYPAKQGDAYYFARNTLIGFYSGNKENEDHAQILAVRWPVPSPKSETPSGKTGKK